MLSQLTVGCLLPIELNGQFDGSYSGLTIGAGSSSVRGLVINRFGPHGIAIIDRGGNVIQGNFM